MTVVRLCSCHFWEVCSTSGSKSVYKAFLKKSISCPNLKPMVSFYFFLQTFCQAMSAFERNIFFSDILWNYKFVSHMQDKKICHLQVDVNNFPAVCRLQIVAVIVIAFSFALSICYFVQGMAISAVTWDAEPLLRPVPVLAWWHLHSADKPRLSCQPCEFQELLKIVSYTSGTDQRRGHFSGIWAARAFLHALYRSRESINSFFASD